MTDKQTDVVARARAALDGVTPGPVQWHGQPGNLKLATVDRGKRYVMGVRRRGMQGATAEFQVDGARVVPARATNEMLESAGSPDGYDIDAPNKDDDLRDWFSGAVAASPFTPEES